MAKDFVITQDAQPGKTEDINVVTMPETSDPTQESNKVLMYSKDSGGTSQLFARSDDGTVHQITPPPAGGVSGNVDDTVQTTNATTTVISTIAMATNDRVMSVEGSIRSASHAGDEVAYYKYSAVFYRDGAGTVTQKGNTTVVDIYEDVAAWDFDLNVSGTNVEVRVTGEAAKTIEWRSFATAVEHG